MKNAFTIDVEDYYQVEAFAGVVNKGAWGNYEPRVVANTRRLLDLLDEHSVKGTFFVLGWVAQHQRALIREIADRGHEIASHGMSHTLVYTQTPDVFRDETRRSKALLEDICQRPVIGYRAATYSITNDSLWALDILHEEGFQYDSSIFPMRHDRYGIPDAQPYANRLRTPAGYSLVEFPISVFRAGAFKLPVAGGGYFRCFPIPLRAGACRKSIVPGTSLYSICIPGRSIRNSPASARPARCPLPALSQPGADPSPARAPASGFFVHHHGERASRPGPVVGIISGTA